MIIGGFCGPVIVAGGKQDSYETSYVTEKGTSSGGEEEAHAACMCWPPTLIVTTTSANVVSIPLEATNDSSRLDTAY